MTTWLKILGVVVLIALAAGLGWFITRPSEGAARVGIVRMTEILEKYQGAADARAGFTRTARAWQSNIDTLRGEMQNMIIDYERDRLTMTASQRASFESILQMKRQQIDDYTAAIQQRATEEQRSVTEKLVVKVKSATESAARDLGLDLVLAVQDEAFVLYSAETVDVTAYVLGHLKQSYTPQADQEHGN
jgi:Skp family chaperone for outer membrane proteins